MGLDFSDGGSFETSHGNNRYSATDIRNGIINAGLYLSGDAVVVPRVNELADSVGMSSGAIFRRFETYSEYVEYVTGLCVVKHSGLVLVQNEEAISSLSERLPLEQEPEKNLTSTSRQKIIDLAQGLDEATKQKVLEALDDTEV